MKKLKVIGAIMCCCVMPEYALHVITELFRLKRKSSFWSSFILKQG